MKNFRQLFIHELMSIYSAETQLVKALPSVMKAASCKKLKEAIRHHLKETKNHVVRLRKIAFELDINLAQGKCPVMQTLLKEGKKTIKAHYDKTSKDAALINCAQRIEHYEMSSYGILKAYAKKLGLDSIYDLLDETSKEEGHADKVLNRIAEGGIFEAGVNARAYRRCA